MGTTKIEKAEAAAYPAEKVRQGEIILNTKWRRIVFFGGLVLLVLVAILLRMGT